VSLRAFKVDLVSKRTWALFSVAVCLSLLCGWGALHFVLPLYLLGFVGAFAMVVVIGGRMVRTVTSKELSVGLFL